MIVKGNILNAELNQFADKRTGEVKSMTKILYTVEREDTDNLVGVGILECYKPGNHLKILAPLTKPINNMGKQVRPLFDIDIEERFEKNGKKFVIKKVNGLELK